MFIQERTRSFVRGLKKLLIFVSFRFSTTMHCLYSLGFTVKYSGYEIQKQEIRYDSHAYFHFAHRFMIFSVSMIKCAFFLNSIAQMRSSLCFLFLFESSLVTAHVTIACPEEENQPMPIFIM